MIRRLYNLCWYLAGTVILIAATAVALVRLFLPDIGAYREEISAWVSRYMGYPVVIQEIGAEWRGWHPQLYLNGVELRAPDSGRDIAHFSAVSISFDPLASLYARRPVPDSLEVAGMRLRLVRDHDGSIQIDGLAGSVADAAPPTAGDELALWLLKQNHITLRNAQILLLDRRGNERPLLLHAAELRLRSDGQRVQLDGIAEPPAMYGERLEFAFDGRGNLLSSRWSGELYVRGRRLQPGTWLNDRLAWIAFDDGTADLELWSSWRDASLVTLEGQAQASRVMLHGADERIESLAVQYRAERDADGGWLLQAAIREWTSAQDHWPPADIALRIAPDQNASADRALAGRISFLPLEAMPPLTTLPGDWRARLEGLRIEGALHDLEFDYRPALAPDERWRYRARFSGLSLANWQERFSVAGLAGHVEGSPRAGVLQLDPAETRIELPIQDALPINLRESSGTLRWQRTDNTLELHGERIDLYAADFAAHLRGRLAWDGIGAPYLDGTITYRGGATERVKPYLRGILSAPVARWLDTAIVGGNVHHAGAVFRGRLADFPFRQRDGQCKIHVALSDITLDYAPDWPPIYQLDAEVIMDGPALTVVSERGKIFDADLGVVRADIDDVFSQTSTLSISGQVTGTAGDALNFFEQSPLRDSPYAQVMRAIAPAGEIGLQLKFNIPLHAGTQSVQGRIELMGNQAAVPGMPMVLEDLRGYVDFNDDKVSARGLQAAIFGHPVQLDISYVDEAPVEIRLNTTLDSAALGALLQRYFPGGIRDDLLQGESRWQATVTTPLASVASAPQIALKSDLLGLAVELPEPFGKPADAAVPLHIDLQPAASGPEFRFRYGDIAAGTLLVGNGAQPLAGQIVFGGEATTLFPASGLQIRGRLGRLRATEWLHWAMATASASSPQRNGTLRNLDIDLYADALEFDDQRFEAVRLTSHPGAGDWRLVLSGAAIEGEITVPETAGAPVLVNFQRLHIHETEPQSEYPTSAIDPRLLPALKLRVEDLQFDEAKLGRMELSAEPAEAGLKIRDFSISSPKVSITGDGLWQVMSEEVFTQIDLELRAAAFADLLRAFNYSAIAIEDGETLIRMQAVWPGSPMDFSLKIADGNLKLDMREGHFLELENRAGRLFGLLSFQALPRRLSLDFDDLFRKGFAFDSITGSFVLEKGNAYTNDLFMDGPSARISVTGRTGLIAQDYDQVVTVTPQIADSLPVASALFGPAGLGVGAVILLAGKMFESIPDQIDRLLRYQYTITGSWENPNIERYGGEKQESG